MYGLRQVATNHADGSCVAKNIYPDFHFLLFDDLMNVKMSLNHFYL